MLYDVETKNQEVVEFHASLRDRSRIFRGEFP